MARDVARRQNVTDDGIAGVDQYDAPLDMEAFDRLPPMVQEKMRWLAVKVAATTVRPVARANGPRQTTMMLAGLEARIMDSPKGLQTVRISSPWVPDEPLRRTTMPDRETRRAGGKPWTGTLRLPKSI